MPNQVARLAVRNHVVNVVHSSSAVVRINAPCQILCNDGFLKVATVTTKTLMVFLMFSHFHSCFAKGLSPFLPLKSCYSLEALSLLMRSRAEEQTANRSVEELQAFQRIAT